MTDQLKRENLLGRKGMLAEIKLDGHGPYLGVITDAGDGKIIVNIPEAHIGAYALDRLSELHYRHEGALQGANVINRDALELEGRPSVYRVRIEATLY